MDQFGADKLVKKMEEYQGLYGAPFKPAQTLVDMAKDPSKKFHKNWTNPTAKSIDLLLGDGY